jgi:type IV secretion system protein VirD4
MIAAALLAMTRMGGQPPERVLFLLDEFAHLGRMQPVERDIALVGGYGVTFWLLVQDLSQLKGTYVERSETFLANCDVLQAVGPNDWDTADYLSKMTGETTILVESENASAGVSRGRHGQRQEGVARTVAEKGRRLLTPDEVLRLGAEESLLFVRGRSPVRARWVS